MVIALLVISVIIFVLLDLILRKEERKSKVSPEKQRAPIFLSPERSLTPLTSSGDRHFHPSHTWIQKGDTSTAFIGIDEFTSKLFSSTLKFENFPPHNSYIAQGSKIWEVKINGRKISQLSPVSGKIAEVNPACRMGIPLNSKDVANSWLVRIDSSTYDQDLKNLLTSDQAEIINSSLHEELILFAQKDHYLNDGGEVDPGFLKGIDDDEWQKFIRKFFPYEIRKD